MAQVAYLDQSITLEKTSHGCFFSILQSLVQLHQVSKLSNSVLVFVGLKKAFVEV
jgi:hypothetical protein